MPKSWEEKVKSHMEYLLKFWGDCKCPHCVNFRIGEDAHIGEYSHHCICFGAPIQLIQKCAQFIPREKPGVKDDHAG